MPSMGVKLTSLSVEAKNLSETLLTEAGENLLTEAEEVIGTDGIWIDFALDVIKKLRIKYGIRGIGPLDRIASTGKMDFEVKNDDENSRGLLGYYSPDHANVREGWGVGNDIRAKLVYSGSTRYKWAGKVDSIKPAPGKYRSRKVKVVCTDWFDTAAKTKVSLQGVQFNVSAEDGIDSLISEMNNLPTASTLSAGQDTFPTIFDSSRD
jgi:hypothetical protein